MSVLGGVDLGSDIYKEDEHSISRVYSEMVRSRGRVPLIFEQSEGPQPFDLVGFSNRGVLKKSQLDALKALADVVDSEITLVYNGVSQTVRFRHWDTPVLEADPLGGREVMTDNDYYQNVRIKLMEVD